MNVTLKIALLPCALALFGCPEDTGSALPPAGMAGQPKAATPAPAPASNPSLKPMAVPDFGQGGHAQAASKPASAAQPGVVVKSAGSQPTDATGAPIGGEAANVAAVSGPVLEAMHVKEYTYIQVQAKEGPVWAAVTKDERITKGKHVSLAKDLWMTDFQSKSLNRTFDRILFGRVVGMN